MKILITGAKGQLGTELTKSLSDMSTEIGPISDSYKNTKLVAVDFDILDITDEKAVFSFVTQGNFDLIINCAAMTNVDVCEAEEDKAFDINAIGAKNLAIASEMIGAKLVHISTDYVFSGTDESDRIESDKTDPQSAYGRTKLAGELLVLEECTKAFVVRTAWLYGYQGNNFVKTMIRLALENGKIKVVSDQFGNPTSANDLAYEILRIAETNNFGIYHCTNKGTCSWFDFASSIVDKAGIRCEKIPCTTAEFPRPAKRPAYSSLENKHLRDTIGDEMRHWEIALNSYIENLGICEGK